MINIYLIRHAQTKGNLAGAYLGNTDEPICDIGVIEAMNSQFPEINTVYTSSMLRCQQTAAILFPNALRTEWDEFNECNFGKFEGKNFDELKKSPEYRKWLISGGRTPFPNGESLEAFQRRCVRGFDISIERELLKNTKDIAYVVHGGTIMAILNKYSGEDKDYYHWQAKNCHGFSAVIKGEQWRREKRLFNIKTI